MMAIWRVPTWREIAVVMSTVLLPAGMCSAQIVDNTIAAFNAADIKGYIQPLADVLGANMNAGLFHSASIGSAEFHLSIEIVGMGSFLGDNEKSYTANSPPGFNPSTFSTATIFGGPAVTVTDVNTKASYRGIAPGIINVSITPLVVPQITVGDIEGTRVMLRFISLPSIDNLPPTKFWGIGAQHSVSQYLSAFPFDVAAHLAYNRLEFGSLIDISALSVGLDASKRLSILSFSGGLAWEKSRMTVKYTQTAPTSTPVDVLIDGVNAFRLTIGLGLRLGLFSIFANVNFGSITNVSGGIGFGG